MKICNKQNNKIVLKKGDIERINEIQTEMNVSKNGKNINERNSSYYITQNDLRDVNKIWNYV